MANSFILVNRDYSVEAMELQWQDYEVGPESGPKPLSVWVF